MATKSLFQKVVIFTVIASFVVWNVAAIAAPVGGQVAAGNATVTQSGSTTTINQSSQNTVINWQGFNTTANEAVKFIQPNASSIALNRITSGLPTSYAGQLTANGQVWILNPAGVLFTSTSKIDVGGLVATTLSMKDSDFMNKNYKLFQSPDFSQGSVINNGSITSHQNGLVALVAPTVENNGTITANMGNVLLASGTVATLDPYGDNLINFAPDNYAVEGSVTNTGKISTDGGKVLMAANSVNNIVKNVVNAGGIIEAKNIKQGADGVIILGGNSGVTSVTGKITSNKIIIKGYDTKIIEAELKSPGVGMIETSGEKISISSGSIIEPGKGGLWYLDPLTINISDYAGLVQSRLQAGINVSLSTGTNLSIAGFGDINVDQAISWNTAATLYLAAYRNINVSQPISSNGGSLVMRADMANNKAGNVNFSGAAAVAGANVMNGGSARIYYNPPGGYISPTNYPSYFSGSSVVKGFMMINDSTDFANMISAGSSTTLFNYSLNTDVDASSYTTGLFPTTLAPTSIFYGTFDGYDYATGVIHTISNLNVSSGSGSFVGGFAGTSAGTIENLKIVNSTVNGNFTGVYVGGVVGYNTGTISNVSYQGDVGSNATAIVGGIAGSNFGALTRVSFNGGIVANVVGGVAVVGGIAGFTSGTINYAAVSGGISNTSNLSSQITGGIAGRVGGTGFSCSSSGAICNSYNLANIVGTGQVGTIGAPTGGIIGQQDSGKTAFINYVYNAGSVQAFVSPNIVALTTVGAILGDLPLPLGGTNLAGIYYNNTTCSNCSTSLGGVGIPNSSMTLQPSYQQGAVVNHFDFTNIWTTNGNTTTPQLKPLVLPVINTVLAQGVLSAPSAQNVALYKNGILQETLQSNASGVYGFVYDPNTIGTNTFLLTTNAAVKGASLYKINMAGPNPVIGLNITSNLVKLDNVAAVGTLSNADLAFASGGPTTPYSVSGNNLTLNAGLGFLTTATTPYSLNGDITAPGALGITFNDVVSLDADSILTSGGVVNFANTVNGAFALTANAAGAVIFGGNVGGVTPLASLTVSSNGPITPAGFVKVTGASSFSAGANAINLSNASNSFGGAISLNNSGSNNVTIHNMSATILAASSIGGTFSLTSNGAISQTGPLSIGGASSFDAGANLIDLSNAGNSFGGVVTFNGTNVALTNLLSTTFAASSASGTLGVTSGSGISQIGVLSVGSSSSFNAGAGVITLTDLGNNFQGQMTLANTGANDVQVYNNNVLDLAPMSIGGNLILTTNGSNIILHGANTSGGAQTYNNPIVLGSNTSLTATAGNIDFTGTIAGAGFDLTTNASPSFNTQIHGDITNVNVLTVNGDVDINANVSTIGAQTYNGLVTLTTDANLVNTVGNINFISGIDGDGYSLSTTTASPFATVFGGAVSSVDVLSVTGKTVINGGSIATLGAQLYNGAIDLGANTDLASTAGNIDFAGTIAGAGFNLTTNASPSFNTQIHGDITNVNVLTVNGDVDINANVSTIGAQTYNGLVTLTTDANLVNTVGNINFISSIDGDGYSLSTTTASPFATVFGGAVSNVDVLSVTGKTVINGGSMATLGAQLYNGAIDLGANTDLASTAGNIEFFDIVDAFGFNLTTHTVDPYSTIFHNNLINVNNLTVDGEATFAGAVLITAAGTASFNDALNGPGSLTLTAANTLISATEGGVPPLSFLTINGPVSFNGSVINASAQTYNGLVTVLSSANPTKMNASGLIHFLNNVEGPGGLILTAAGIQFDGDVGGIAELSLFDITAPVTFTGSNTFNAAIQNYRGPVTISGAAVTINGSASVNFFDKVSGPGSLTIDAPITQFTGTTSVTPLNVLTVLHDVILNGASIKANQQIYQGPATIGAGGANLISPDVQFLTTISGPGALSITGNLTALNDINIKSLSVTGTTLYNKGTNQNITTLNGQKYGNTVTLNNNLNILNNGFGYINFGGGGVYGPTFDLSAINMSWTITNGVTGSVNVNSLTLGGTGGATLINSFLNSLNYAQLTIGYYCVNGSCEAFYLNAPEAQRFIAPENTMACDASGCTNAYIDIKDSYLLRAFDPLREICVVGVDGTESCLGGSQETM